MSVTSEKLQYLKETKEHIKNAIINKGVNIPDDANFRDYENYIANIPTDGAVPLNRRYEHYEGSVISVLGSDAGFTKNNKYTASYAGTPNGGEYLLKFNVNNGIGVDDRNEDKNITFKIPHPICTINRNGKVYKNEIKYNTEKNKYEFIRQCKTNKEELLSTKQVSDSTLDKITLQYEAGYAGSVGVGDKLYILGGRNYSTTYTTRLMVFDIKTCVTSVLSPIPVGRQYHGLVHHNGKLYAIGGKLSSSTISNELYIYDIETDTWTTGTSMKYYREYVTAEVVNDKIYVIGSNSTNGNKVEVYDIAANTWSELNNLPMSYLYATAHHVYNNKIYFYGGNQGYTSSTEINVYNTENDTWEIGVNYLSKSCGSYANAILYNNKVYISGGLGNVSGFTIYDIVNNEFLDLESPLLPVGLYSHHSIICDDELYLVGGMTSEGSSYILSPNYGGYSQHYIKYDLTKNIFTVSYHGSKSVLGHYYTNSCEYNNYIYIVGATSSSSTYSHCLKYNLKTQRFESMTNINSARAGAATGILNGKLYVLGGRSSSNSMNTIQIYDIENNKWSTHTNTTPNKVHDVGYTTYNNKLYYCGGYDSSVSYEYSNKFYCYDPTLDKFEELHDLPFKGSRMCMVSVDKYLYVLGGYDYTNGATYTNRCYKYDTETKEFTSISNMPTPRRCGAAIEIDGKIYVIGGYNSSIGDLSKIEVYDIATDTWTVLPDVKGSRIPYPGLGYCNGYIQIVNVTDLTIGSTESDMISKTILLDINKIVVDDVALNEIIELEGNFDLPTTIHNTIISPTTGENVIIECDVPVSYKV